MRIAVVAPCIFEDTAPCHYLVDSARHFGIPLQLHGLGEQFVDWKDMLLRFTLPHMRELARGGYTHALYVDGRDTLFNASLNRILAAYEKQGSPKLLISSDERPILNAGGYIAEIPWWVGVMTALSEVNSTDGDYQNWIMRAWPIEGGKIDELNIFRPVDCDPPNETVSQAMILHFRGGCADPATGRDERMRPWAEALCLD